MIWQLMVLRWPKVELDNTGSAIVPKVCPNCMAEATREWRTEYSLPILVSRSRFYQTFYYCDACSNLIRYSERTRMIQWLVGIALFCGCFYLVLQGPKELLSGRLGLSLTIVIPIVVALLIGLARRRAKLLPPEALVVGYAAYYTGFDGFNNAHIYRARRQEWLDLLVTANPDQVSDELYFERTAKAKPEEKPF